MNPVVEYVSLYKRSKLNPREFAMHASAYHKDLCTAVLDRIGMWPAGDVELRALQVHFKF